MKKRQMKTKGEENKEIEKEVVDDMGLNYRILLRKEPEGGYTVIVPSLPGCIERV